MCLLAVKLSMNGWQNNQTLCAKIFYNEIKNIKNIFVSFKIFTKLHLELKYLLNEENKNE